MGNLLNAQLPRQSGNAHAKSRNVYAKNVVFRILLYHHVSMPSMFANCPGSKVTYVVVIHVNYKNVYCNLYTVTESVICYTILHIPHHVCMYLTIIALYY